MEPAAALFITLLLKQVLPTAGAGLWRYIKQKLEGLPENDPEAEKLITIIKKAVAGKEVPNDPALKKFAHDSLTEFSQEIKTSRLRQLI